MLTSGEAAGGPAAGSLPHAVGFLRDAWRHHGLSALLVAGVVIAGTAAFLLLAPKKYRSDAQVLVRPGRESVTLDPTAATGDMIAVSATRENEINSVLEVLSSRANLDAVVHRLGPEVVLGKAPLPEDAMLLAGDDGRHVTFKPATQQTPSHTLAVKGLARNLSMDAVRRSSVINASVVASSPELAQTMLAAYLDVAIERHMRASRSSGTLQFFQEQTAAVNEEYQQVSDRLSDLKSRIGVSSLEDRRKTLQERFAALETAIATTKAELAEAEASVNGLSGILEELTPTVLTSTTTGQPEDSRGVAEKTRSLLKIERKKYLARYTAAHPKVQEIDEQLAEIDRIVRADNGDGQKVESQNPAWLKLETDRATAKAAVISLTGKLTAQERQLDVARERLGELNDAEPEIAGLEEQIRVLRGTAGDYTKKLEQARIDRALEEERLSNIAITQPPTYEAKAVSPQRRIVGAAGLLLAFGLGLTLMLGREYWDRASRPTTEAARYAVNPAAA